MTREEFWQDAYEHMLELLRNDGLSMREAVAQAQDHANNVTREEGRKNVPAWLGS